MIKMNVNTSEIISEQPRGFAGLIARIMEKLNDNPDFKESFKNVNRKYILNATNLDWAAFIEINNGTIKVRSVPNKPRENLKKKVLDWDGFLEMDSRLFLKIALKRISFLKIGFKWITGKIKMKGITKLLTLLKIFNYLE